MAEYRKESENGVVSKDLCADANYWHSADYASTEVEVAQMIGGLVRGLQPDVVVELGTHTGETTRWIGNALACNGHGVCYAVDADAAALARCGDRTMGQPVLLVHADAELWCPPRLVDFLFVDHGHVNDRARALRRMLPYLSDRGVVAVHDTGTHWSLWPKVRAVAQQHDCWYLPLPTPRGLTLLRRYLGRDGRSLLR